MSFRYRTFAYLSKVTTRKGNRIVRRGWWLSGRGFFPFYLFLCVRFLIVSFSSYAAITLLDVVLLLKLPTEMTGANFGYQKKYQELDAPF